MQGEQLSLPLDAPSVPPGTPLAPPAASAVDPPGGYPRRPPVRHATRPQPFHYTEAMREVVVDIVAALEELRHVDLDRVLLSVAQARQASRHGVYASCVPLRFEGGARETVSGRRRFRMPEVRHEGREILYILYFMLPRFHDEQDYPEKLATIIHELYHISPAFDGDIRRFPGKNFAHGHSRERYHARMRELAARYLEISPRAREHAFLQTPFSDLLRRPGGVVGFSIARPKAVLVPPPGAPKGGRRGASG